jgi:hypothetical protein
VLESRGAPRPCRPRLWARYRAPSLRRGAGPGRRRYRAFVETLARSLTAAAIDMVSILDIIDREQDIDSRRTTQAVAAWVGVHGVQQATVTLTTSDRFRIAGAIARGDRARVEHAVSVLVDPLMVGLTDGALLPLEHAIGASAEWVGQELGAQARERFLLDLRAMLLGGPVTR